MDYVFDIGETAFSAIYKFNTITTETLSGEEFINVEWEYPIATYNLSKAFLDDEQLQELVELYESLQGTKEDFGLKDYFDFQATNEPFLLDQDLYTQGVLTPIPVDGTNKLFQLCKSYSCQGLSVYRPITRIKQDTLKVFINGTEITGGFILNTGGSILFSSAPPTGATLTASFEFYIDVRFDSPFNANLLKYDSDDQQSIYEISQINLVEVRKEVVVYQQNTILNNISHLFSIDVSFAQEKISNFNSNKIYTLYNLFEKRFNDAQSKTKYKFSANVNRNYYLYVLALWRLTRNATTFRATKKDEDFLCRFEGDLSLSLLLPEELATCDFTLSQAFDPIAELPDPNDQYQINDNIIATLVFQGSLYTFSGGNLYKWGNGVWTQFVTTGLTGSIQLVFKTNTNLYALTAFGLNQFKLFYSSNGITWQEIPNVNFNFDNSYIYNGTPYLLLDKIWKLNNGYQLDLVLDQVKSYKGLIWFSGWFYLGVTYNGKTEIWKTKNFIDLIVSIIYENKIVPPAPDFFIVYNNQLYCFIPNPCTIFKLVDDNWVLTFQFTNFSFYSAVVYQGSLYFTASGATGLFKITNDTLESVNFDPPYQKGSGEYKYLVIYQKALWINLTANGVGFTGGVFKYVPEQQIADPDFIKTTQLVRCWQIIRKDGVTFGFTSSDIPIEYDGEIFEAFAGFTPKAIQLTNEANVNNTEIDSIISSDAIKEADIVAGKFDLARVQIFLLDKANLTRPPIILLDGYIGEIKYNSRFYTAEIRSKTQLLQQVQSKKTTSLCPLLFGEIGDAKCNKDLNGDIDTYTLATVFDSKTLTVNSGRPDGFFSEGSIEFLTGINQGYVASVGNFQDKVFYLWEPLPFVPSPGDQIKAKPGCKKTLEACKGWGNVVNFGGDPFIPGSDEFIAGKLKAVKE